ncbi:hypothetical protein GCM10011320_55440 [Neoroseomonas lacus]|uniref:Uncharacterized protein n=1 Tax=Neoroseomonas lacus TaxID=287609 RepID=A0A917NY50_9PROT|nr:hypothetical protein GCM10011320_55440 [Neoroseomonas lacus]
MKPGASQRFSAPVRKKGASTASAAEPRHADTLTDAQSGHIRAQALDGADDLVAWDQPGTDPGQVAVHYMQVGPSDAAGADPAENLLRPG